MNLPSQVSCMDLEGPAEIEKLVNAFYAKVRQDELLGFIFEKVAGTDWETHLPRMYAFWEKVLFRTGTFTGNPLAVHARLVSLTEMGRPQFDRWLQIFHETVDGLFTGPNAEHIKNSATDMAHVIYSRINGVVDPRFDPARLSPEQRSRYTASRTPAVTV